MSDNELPKALDPNLPVIVGVGQLLNRTDKGADPLEPVKLMAEAAAIAETDTGVTGLLKRAQVVAAVPTISWRYRDPGAIVAELHGAQEAKTWYASVGGNTPQSLMNRICSHIQSGELEVALLIGGEAGRARKEAKRHGGKPNWTIQTDEVAPDWLDDSPFLMGDEADMARNLIMPLQLYPVFENAIWHQSGRTLTEHVDFIGRMWSGYSQVAATNPFAWKRKAFTPEQIVDVTPDNRMVAFPYRKRMVANPSVDMASAAIICSAGKAAELGIPTDRWVFIHSASEAKDRSVSTRWDLARSPAIAAAGRRTLEQAGVTIDEVAHLDVYSCYPSAVQVATSELGIDPSRQLTVYGGLPFAGGPWNNPVGHAIAAMTDVLRSDPGSLGLVTANGGNIDKHAFGIYSTNPPASGFRFTSAQEQADEAPERPSVVNHEGGAVIESWSVMYDRNSEATKAHIAALTPEGERTWALNDDPDVMGLLTTTDATGLAVLVDGQGNFELA